jgi:3-phosphoshikimate 1-carboxyvinyltransferase
VTIDASTSSQFVSSLLLTLPTLPTSSVVDLRGAIVSEPYIESTLALLRDQRIRILRPNQRQFRIPGGQRYARTGVEIPGDASSAAYLWSAAAITGGDITIEGIQPRWPQADLAILRILASSGARVKIRGSTIRVRGGSLRAFSARLTDAPDLFPLVGVLASRVPGRSRLTGAPHLRYKESDRRVGTERLVRAMGAKVHRISGGLEIRGSTRLRGFRLENLHDHRLIMSAAVGATAGSSPSRIGDSRQVQKSFPDFWKVLRRCGMRSVPEQP